MKKEAGVKQRDTERGAETVNPAFAIQHLLLVGLTSIKMSDSSKTVSANISNLCFSTRFSNAAFHSATSKLLASYFINYLKYLDLDSP